MSSAGIIVIGVVIAVVSAGVLGLARAVWRKAGQPVVDGVQEIRSLLVTDEKGMGVMDRLDRIDGLIAERTPIFDEVRLQVAELVRQSGLIFDRTETLTPNGGSSLVDRVARIDDNTPDVKAGGPAHAVRPPVKPAPKPRAPRRRTT